MKKVLAQIDGSNFYKKFKNILPSIHLTTYKYRELIQSLVIPDSPKIRYYVGSIKRYSDNKKSVLLYAQQQSLFSNLRQQKISIKLGYLLMTNGVFHEKGVDVQIASDMVYGAVKNEYDTCYLFSSDTDLLPAIRIARAEGKKVIYVGFSSSISKALVRNCSSTVILNKEQLINFA